MSDDSFAEVTARQERLYQELDEMQSETTCAYCIHRGLKRICGSQSSPHFNLVVDLKDTCGSFCENPAQLMYVRAVILDKHADKAAMQNSDVVKAFNQAIEQGLPSDDELHARFDIAKRLVFWINDQDLNVMQRSKLHETAEAIRQFELALLLDQKCGLGFFEEERGRLMLSQLDLMYVIEGTILSIEQGQNGNTSDAAALEYWESKISNCGYLSTNPLISTLVHAGYAYSRVGRKEDAINCFRLAVDAGPVNISEKQESEMGQKREARECLEQLTQPSQTPPEMPAAKAEKDCFIATAVYGDRDALEVKVLRCFRDQYLESNLLTRWLVGSYYRLSPPLASLIRKNGSLRAICKCCLNCLVCALGKIERVACANGRRTSFE